MINQKKISKRKTQRNFFSRFFFILKIFSFDCEKREKNTYVTGKGRKYDSSFKS